MVNQRGKRALAWLAPIIAIKSKTRRTKVNTLDLMKFLNQEIGNRSTPWEVIIKKIRKITW